jgi:hypothetical protein
MSDSLTQNLQLLQTNIFADINPDAKIVEYLRYLYGLTFLNVRDDDSELTKIANIEEGRSLFITAARYLQSMAIKGIEHGLNQTSIWDIPSYFTQSLKTLDTDSCALGLVQLPRITFSRLQDDRIIFDVSSPSASMSLASLSLKMLITKEIIESFLWINSTPSFGIFSRSSLSGTGKTFATYFQGLLTVCSRLYLPL